MTGATDNTSSNLGGANIRRFSAGELTRDEPAPKQRGRPKARLARLLGGDRSSSASKGPTLEEALQARQDDGGDVKVEMLDLTTKAVGDAECHAIAGFVVKGSDSLSSLRLGGS